jgi:beta-N-acetylhexosaminidase
MTSQIGEMFMLGFRGPKIPRWLERFAADFGLGGVILFDYDCLERKYERNVFSPAQVKELCEEIHALPSKPRVYVDQEGGKVRRLKEKYGFAPLASAQAFARLSSAEQREQLVSAYRQMREIGIDCNLAPVVDLNLNPANPDLGAVERCYSADPAVVQTCARTVAEAASAAGVELCLKHFPGCGAATVNSHEELMDLSAVVSEAQVDMFRELLPLVPMVLFSHGLVRFWDDHQPVSLSSAAVRRVRAWCPDAVLITDDLQMEGMQKRMSTKEACVLAARAGIDLICIGNNMRDEQEASCEFANALLAAAETDMPTAQNIRNSITRLKARKR